MGGIFHTNTGFQHIPDLNLIRNRDPHPHTAPADHHADDGSSNRGTDSLALADFAGCAKTSGALLLAERGFTVGGCNTLWG